ncbi:Ubiquinone biosynthesis O-methyltransferase [Paramyrothecium foliicola]|nr:Ubiquinone biosynthesis O-methyltransferase [Paramyrothecium foliicola]
MSAASSLKNRSRFNAEAAAWDSNPFVHQRSLEAWEVIKKRVPAFRHASTRKPDILEIGCGTGLLSLPSSTRANRLVAVDAADGMIEVLKTKLTRPGVPTNITPLCLLLEDPEDPQLPPADPSSPDGPRLKFDVVTSHLVLHHIADVEAVLKTMLGCLRPGGVVALTDFEDFGPEAKRFHPEAKLEGVERHGINRAWMTDLLEKVGFTEVDVRVGWTAQKRVERYPGEFLEAKATWDADGGETMMFPFLLCIGKKPESSTA